MSKFFEKKVEYSEDGTTWIDLGHIMSDGSENNVEAASEETSGGLELYAGSNDELVVMVPDTSKYAALEAIMKDDTKQGTLYVRTTDAEGVTDAKQGYSVIVQQGKNFSPRTRNSFLARFKRTFI